jgi:predicted anti-sigma-YlaC factor YlaD
MLRLVPPSGCSDAREAVSARLDGELAELDELRLESHLRDCADCREFAREAAAAAGLLRDAALERPPAWTWTAPRRDRRRLSAIAGVAAVAAAAVAVAAAPSFLLGRTLGKQPQIRTATGTSAYEPSRSLVDPALLAMLRGQEVPGGRIIHI